MYSVSRAASGAAMTQGDAFAASFQCAPVLPLSEPERWYVARTLPQRELHAARQLANQGFRIFVPRHWKNRRHARKVETKAGFSPASLRQGLQPHSDVSRANPKSNFIDPLH